MGREREIRCIWTRRKQRGARRRPLRAAERCSSGLAAGKAHGRGTGAVVGLDVDETDHALLDLLPRALQGRADALGLFDIFGVAAERLGRLVIACVFGSACIDRFA